MAMIPTPVKVPGGKPRDPAPSFMQGLFGGNAAPWLTMGAGLMAAGAPTTDPGHFGTTLGQTFAATGQQFQNAATERKQAKAIEGLLAGGNFTPQQEAAMRAMDPGGAIQLAGASAFQPQAQPKTPGLVNVTNPTTGEMRSVVGTPQNLEMVAKSGYVLAGDYQAPKAATPTSLARNLELAGYVPGTPEYAAAMKEQLARSGAGVSITQVPAPPTGYMYEGFDARGLPVGLVPIPGGPAAMAMAAADEKAASAQEGKERVTGVVSDDINRALGMLDQSPDLVSGLFGPALSVVPGSVSADFQNVIQGIRANLAFDRLQQMKEQSPTGGALGSVSEGELKLLEGALGSLAQSQTAEQLRYNLKRIHNLYMDTIHGEGSPHKRYDLTKDSTRQELPPATQGGAPTHRWNPDTGVVPIGPGSSAGGG
jgi:hypothetical protein